MAESDQHATTNVTRPEVATFLSLQSSAGNAAVSRNLGAGRLPAIMRQPMTDAGVATPVDAGVTGPGTQPPVEGTSLYGVSALPDPAVRERLRRLTAEQGYEALNLELSRMTQELQAKRQEIDNANRFRQDAAQYPHDVSGTPWSEDMFAQAAIRRDQMSADVEDAQAYAANLNSRLEHFKHVVCQAAAIRLEGNEQALGEWQAYLDTQLTPGQVMQQAEDEQERHLIAHASLGQGLPALERRSHMTNPYARQVEQRVATGQIGGGCQYCHEMNNAIGRFHQDPSGYSPDLMTQFEQHVAAEHTSPTPEPPLGPAARGDAVSDPRLAAFPGVRQESSLLDQLPHFVHQLGDDGFKVLPSDIIDTMAGGGPHQVVARIRELILLRRNNFLVLARQCRAPGFDYLVPRPVLRELLPTAEEDVQGCVRGEIARAQSDAEAEAVIVGAATVLALLLTVFPPTAPLGMAMDAGLAGYGLVSGYAAYEQGQTLSLGAGSTVLDPEQQEAADGLKVMGAVAMALSALNLVGISVQSVRIFRAGGEAGGAAQRAEAMAGPYRIEVTDLETGSPRATVSSTGGGGLPPDFQVPDDFTFSADGPLVSVPARPNGQPARVLDVGAGPQDAPLGLPPEPGRGDLTLVDRDLVDLTRSDIRPRPGVTEWDATRPPPTSLRGQDALIINNPRGYDVDVGTVGQAIRPGGRIIIQGRAEVTPGMRGVNPNMTRILRAAEQGRLPADYRVVEIVTDPAIPSGSPEAVPRPPDVLGGPFSRTEGGAVSWPNTRIIIEKLPTAR
ncbi:hypothetical protein DMA12_24350 [Amycolatopsis balhimycina DSM 5908]|uniref:Uncharacterized protein n=1 Tax=Amycolatopsis balhimycina DSM 5908 TaxID=1081091 RepID=A0A428WEI0_AMYBA|nr:hypothetical protein [Amycolatopsis balhimycina]RSM41456.1 hypothetical protein DMA12_24350 [Amycolatopsis balhimycina DSM 5908]